MDLFKFGDGQFMFVFKNKLAVEFLIYCLQKQKIFLYLNSIMLINVKNQFYTMSQTVDQNDDNEIIFILGHKLLNRTTTVKFCFILPSKLIFALSYSIIRSFEINN